MSTLSVPKRKNKSKQKTSTRSCPLSSSCLILLRQNSKTKFDENCCKKSVTVIMVAAHLIRSALDKCISPRHWLLSTAWYSWALLSSLEHYLILLSIFEQSWALLGQTTFGHLLQLARLSAPELGLWELELGAMGTSANIIIPCWRKYNHPPLQLHKDCSTTTIITGCGLITKAASTQTLIRYWRPHHTGLHGMAYFRIDKSKW